MTDFGIWSQSGSSIQSWLAGQPENSEDYKPSESGDREKSPRRRVSHSRKRRPLREIEGNPVPMPPKKGQRPSPEKREGKDPWKKQQQGSPEKRKKKDTGKRADSKASRKPMSLNEVPKLDPPDDDTRGSRSQDGSTSTDRKRSPSPRKTRYNLTLAEIQVVPVAIGSGVAPSPEEMQELYDDLIDLQTRQGLLPASIRDRAKQQLAVRDRDYYYCEESDSTDREQTPAHVRTWQDALDIRDAARECTTDDAPESSWNMDVNSSLLRLALRDHWKSQEIWYKDLTTSRIYDKDLLPKVPGISHKSKMVDLGIVIKPRRLGPLWEKISGKCAEVAYKTVNQTNTTHISQTPIAVSGEVKRAGGDEAESFVQLSTWVTAHYAHLQILLEKSGNADATLPALPLLQIIGDRWRLIIAEMKLEKGQMIFHSDVELGSSKDILGIYQIIASLRRLAEWTSKQYRPWWTKMILGYDEESLMARTQDSSVSVAA
ncbi:MAG: hypothetical protein Q9208_003906 [Pyrenodesmia sp. 3 TL-2023]